MPDSLNWIILFVLTYLLGAIPFGFLIGKSQGVDIREHGSKNIGATNTGRVLGKKWGIICFVLDVLKGMLPTFLAGWWMRLLGVFDLGARADGSAAPASGEQLLWMAVGAAAILGHMYPIYLTLRGGKGVATAFGVMLGVFPFLTLPAIGALIVWLVLLAMGRMVSLASMGGALSLPMWLVLACALFDFAAGGENRATFIDNVRAVWPFIVVSLLLAVLIIHRHRPNIARILAGAEPKLHRRSSAETTRDAP